MLGIRQLCKKRDFGKVKNKGEVLGERDGG
jgi:hypothetical protein